MKHMLWEDRKPATPGSEEAQVIAKLQEMGSLAIALDDFIHGLIELRKQDVPILAKWLRRSDDFEQKARIARALTDKIARGTGLQHVLVEELRALPSYTHQSDVKWAIGNALSVVADDAVFDDLCELVRQTSNEGRQVLVEALARSRNPRVVGVLIDRLDDRFLRQWVLAALRRKRAKGEPALPRVRELLDDEDPRIRKDAARTIESIEGAIDRRRLSRKGS